MRKGILPYEYLFYNSPGGQKRFNILTFWSGCVSNLIQIVTFSGSFTTSQWTLKGSGKPIRYFSGGRRPLVQLFMLLCSDIIPWSTHKAHEHITFLCFSPISCGDCHFVWFIYLKLLFRPLGTWIWAPSAAAASFASQHCNCTVACNLAHCHWCCENAFTWGRTV